MPKELSKEPELSHAEKTRPILNKKVLVYLRSGVRKRHTRFKRMHDPMSYRARFVQRIAGDIVVRRSGRAGVTEAQFNKHFEEIKKRVKAGLLEVVTLEGRVIDIDTMKPTGRALKPAAPKPEPVRAAHMPAGRFVPAIPGGKAQGEKVEPPKVTQPAIPDGEPAKEPVKDLESAPETPKMSETPGLPPEEKSELEKLETKAAEEGPAEPKGEPQPKQEVPKVLETKKLEDESPPPPKKTESSKKSSKKGSKK